ncbi:hypothetical protein SOVF_092790, partial [Spinacia oleracea]
EKARGKEEGKGELREAGFVGWAGTTATQKVVAVLQGWSRVPTVVTLQGAQRRGRREEGVARGRGEEEGDGGGGRTASRREEQEAEGGGEGRRSRVVVADAAA